MSILLAILTLMTKFELDTGVMKLKVFDVIIVLSAAYYALLFLFRGFRISIPLGLLLMLPFFLLHVTEARYLGFNNVLREGIQVVVVLTFALLMHSALMIENMMKYAKVLGIGLAVILTYVVLWHVLHGHLSGWKELGAAKFVFSLFPIMLAFLALKDQYMPSKWTRYASPLLFIYVPMVLMSGERKALLLTLVLLTVVFSRLYIFKKPASIATIFLGLLGFTAVLPVILQLPYVQRQLESVTAEDSTKLILNNDGSYSVVSPSNAQRMFALEETKKLVREYPFIGIGTNMYKEYVKKEHSALPGFIKVEIHSEFQRALVELGIIGLLVYLMPIIRTFFFIARCNFQAETRVIRDLGLTIALGFVLIMGTEGGGTQQFVLYIILALFPDMARKMYRQHQRSLAENPAV